MVKNKCMCMYMCVCVCMCIFPCVNNIPGGYSPPSSAPEALSREQGRGGREALLTLLWPFQYYLTHPLLKGNILPLGAVLASYYAG